MDTYDWKSQNADSVYNEFIKQARDGSIALLHDTHSTSVTAALRAIDTLKAQGYEFVTLSEMFMRRGVALQNGKMYYSCYPGSYGTDPAVKKPVITVEDTAEGKLVSISGDSRGSVYYTLNGQLPTPNNSTKYTAPFIVTGDTDVKAVTVIKWNGIRTDTVEKLVKYNPAPVPEMSVSDGILTISSSVPGAEIYYTADGSVPTKESTRYEGAIELAGDTTYRARVYAQSFQPGIVGMLTYTSRGNVFTDVTTDHWAYDTIDRVFSEGIFRGVTATEFSPDTPLTRAMLVTVLYRMAGEPDVSGLKANFKDVPGDYWCYDALAWASSCGVINGYADGSFRPNAACTKAQALTFLWRAAGSPNVSCANPFSDVSSSSPYYKAILWAYKTGIAGAESGSSFQPNRECPRADMVLYIWRSAGSPKSFNSVGFTDISSLGSDSRQAIRWAVSEGIVTGYSDTSFRPYETCSRAHVVTFLYRYIN